jgi:hypothetical protein
MEPANLQVLFQLGFFGLLVLLAVWVKGLIEASNKKCDEQTAKLGQELKESHATTQRILETTIKESNATREKQIASFDALTGKLSGLHCIQRENR